MSKPDWKHLILELKGQLIVSCQARPGDPLDDPAMIAALAASVEMGGAGGLRINSPANVAAVRRVSQLPIIGIWKERAANQPPLITPTFGHALAVVRAGADVVALDATERRPTGELADLIRRIREDLGVPVMADCSTLAEGMRAAELGADLVATTLAGYTPQSRQLAGVDVELVRELSGTLAVPVVAEGRISEPAEVAQCLEAGAYAVVVGRAITRPQDITARFVAATHSAPIE